MEYSWIILLKAFQKNIFLPRLQNRWRMQNGKLSSDNKLGALVGHLLTLALKWNNF